MWCGSLSLWTNVTRPPTATVASNGIRPNGVIDTLAVPDGGAGPGVGAGAGAGEGAGAGAGLDGPGDGTAEGAGPPDEPHPEARHAKASTHAPGNRISRMVIPRTAKWRFLWGPGTRLRAAANRVPALAAGRCRPTANGQRLADAEAIDDALDALAVARDCHRLVRFGPGLHRAVQRDDAVARVDVDVQARHARFRQELRLHRGRDRRVGEHLAGLVGGLLGLHLRIVRRVLDVLLGLVRLVFRLLLVAAGCRGRHRADDEVVNHAAHAIDVARDEHGALLLGLRAHRSVQRHHVIVRVDVDLRRLHGVVGGHLRLHGRGDARIGLRTRGR